MTLEELTERSTEEVARARAERIRAGIHNYLETLAEIALAWERRDWAALGYPDWSAYVDGEFGAARLKLPAEHRQKAVQELRLAGMSQRAIAGTLGVNRETVIKDIAKVVGNQPPDQIRGADGKTYAAARPTSPAPPAVTAGPAPGEQVWIATARKGIAAHAIKSQLLTRCSRATRTGLTVTAQQAAQRWEATWCGVCWPETETTRFAAGETASTGPGGETHDPRASREAGAEIRDSAPAGTSTETAARAGLDPLADGAATASVDETPASPVVHAAGVAAPAPAPPSATSPVAGGAGVTPAEPEEPRLAVDQIARLRAVFAWARARLARHPMSAAGRGRPCVIGREYSEAERSPEPTRDQHWPGLPARERAAHVEVSWEARSYAEVGITYRSERHVISEQQIAVPGVDEALDVLCALGVLPAWFSRQYAAGVQAGMRAGDAIDGEWTES